MLCEMFINCVDESQNYYSILYNSYFIQGKWKPRRIANPHYYEDKYPYKMTPIVSNCLITIL